ncbi:flagellar protein FliT [Clostridium tagluense]|uniref:flagellar protein FliT n=1 Tax=Clostridium tagluense TaxID=360422 RepID=UPI001C6EC9A1|nr:flagellar protein FliT [Clostridium tagluense]MBW9154967.1 flagellar protein FliT [Clostridium tagluense]WLC64420.1 flagellar protein FliT [Clostridium tagluense]
MKELVQELMQFKKVTMELMEALQQDEVHKLDTLLDSRQIAIENMGKLEYTTEEFSDICNELDILKVQNELLKLMQTKKDDTKEELNKIQLTKNANNNYNKSFYNNLSMFNKKI